MPVGRVLITGISNFWGARLAAILERDADIERVFGLDTRPPRRRLERTELIEADIRSPDLAEAIAATDAEIVVHNDVLQFAEPGRSARTMHDINVIGSLQLLAACERLPRLRAIVVRGSAAIYGSEPDAPQFFAEDMARRYPKRTRFQRDLAELEKLFETFARRRPQVACTVLRCQPVIGPTLDTPVTRLFRLPALPTHLGFDPRMQFLHEDDSVEALAAAIRRPVRGPVNVAGPGTVSLTRTLRRLGVPSIPIAHPLYRTVVGAASRLARVEMSDDMVRFLRYGRGVELRRLAEEVGFHPRHSTAETIELLARSARAPAGAAA